MATIDPSIALGIKPVQIENPLAVQGRAMEGAVNALKYQDLQRATQEDQEVKNFLRGADLSKPETRAELNTRFGKTGMGYGKLLAEQEKAGLETKKLTGDITKQQLEASRQRISDLAFNPSNANITAHLEDSVKRGEMNQQQADQLFAQVVNMPLDQRKQTFLLLGADASKRIEQMTLSEFQKQNLGIQREGQRLQYDPTTQANITKAKKRAEGEVAREVQGQVDVVANRKALATAGYDAATGKDDISELIKKSTGSYLGKAIDIGERVYGGSNEGSRALQTLTQKANAITFGLLNGKLGAGISKSDAELVASLVGQLGDGTLPVADRLAAWESAKNNMVRLGMLEAPANNVNVPGVGLPINTPGSGAAPAAKPSLDDIFKPKK
jgi:hypothetical protein